MDLNLGRRRPDLAFIAGVAAVFFNLGFWGVMYMAQEWESRRGRIPRRSRNFFYLQDFHTSGWGDTIGLTIMDIGTAMLIFYGWSIGMVFPTFLFLGIGAGSAILFAVLCLHSDHKPDAGYPAPGQISWQGKVHLVYFGFHIAYGLLGISLLVKAIFNGSFVEMLPYIATGLSGLAIYALAFVLDIKRGHFQSAPKQEAYSQE